MKTILCICFLAVCSAMPAQHLGNFNNQAVQMDISRANIATSMGNGYINQQKRHHSQPLQPSNILTLNLKSLYNIEATDYTAVFNINQVGASAQEATDLMNQKVDAIKAALKQDGFTGQFSMDMISFVPQYEIEVTKKLFSKTYTEVPVGFELQQNLLISYKNDDDFQKILTACANNEVYNLVKVDYYVNNLDKIYKKLQEKLLEEVSAKKNYYEALGFDMSTYDVFMADKKYYHVPKDYYRSYQAAENVSVEAAQKKKVTRVKKPTSYYYDPISYDGYDVVVNAGISKPVIQLGMDLSLRYQPKPEKPKEPKPVPPAPAPPKPKVYVISPDGPVHIKQMPDS